MRDDGDLKALTDAIEAVSARYAERFGIRRDVEWCLLKLAEELGELTQAHLKRVGQARVDGNAPDLTRRFEDEMADVLGQLLVLAKLSGTDLYAALDRKWLRWHPSRMSGEAYLDAPPDNEVEPLVTASVSQEASPTVTPLQVAVGVTALVAPSIHSLTDAIEWYAHGFSTVQLWLNYIAFVPMSWLLLGIYAVHDPKPRAAGLIGALLYGAAFTYFAHTTLFALDEHVADYETLWQHLGDTYTANGGLMVSGGLLFAWSILRAGWLPRFAVFLFLAGVATNLVLSVLPAPDILQTIGSAVRNAGLVAMGYFILFERQAPHARNRLERHRHE